MDLLLLAILVVAALTAATLLLLLLGSGRAPTPSVDRPADDEAPAFAAEGPDDTGATAHRRDESPG